MSTLVKRILAAIVAVPLLLALTFWAPVWLFNLVVGGVLFLGLAEWFKLSSTRMATPLVGLGFLSLLLLLVSVPAESLGFGFRGASACVLMLLGTGYLMTDRPLSAAAGTLSQTVFGVFYFGGLGGYVLLLRAMPTGAWALLLLYLSTWAYDTGGYFAGKYLGRHKMSPQVSPKKTWEGFAGGTALCMVTVWFFFANVPEIVVAPWARLVLGALLALWGQTGDLVESLLKRSLKAKDSGAFLPGHGGVFDRIDSLLFNAPLVYFALWLFQVCPCFKG
jgi:phosphatidate cytidylyltransferase